MSGSCNPSQIEKIRKLGAPVKTRDGMHAKVWLCGDRVIVGSANVSANGLGFDDAEMIRGNREAAVLIEDSEVAKSVDSWFSKMWEEDCELVNNGQIKTAKDRWRKNRKSSFTQQRVKKPSLLERVRQTWGSDQRREKVRILVWEEAEDQVPDENGERMDEYSQSADAQKLYTRTEWEQEEKCSYWRCFNQNWQFKNGDIYLEFRYSPGRSKLKFTGIYRVVARDKGHVKIGNEYVVMCYQERNCHGYRLTKPEENELLRLIKNLNEEGKLIEDEANNLVDKGIGEFIAN